MVRRNRAREGAAEVHVLLRRIAPTCVLNGGGPYHGEAH